MLKITLIERFVNGGAAEPWKIGVRKLGVREGESAERRKFTANCR